MNRIVKRPLARLGYDFVPAEYLPEGKDEFYLRETQQDHKYTFRGLHDGEIEVLVKNENTADSWDRIFVTDRFNPDRVKRCQFFGMVRIGALEDYYLEYHDLRLPVGLYNSTIVSCDIGSNVVIDNVRYLGHYILGDEVVLLNIDEMLTTNCAKFGNGIVKEGEPEEDRAWIYVGNENEHRGVMPFEGMLPADAWFWSKHREDEALLQRFKQMTEASHDSRRGYYGQVGDRSIIKDCRILKDVKIGSDAYIKGANKLKNLTILSDADEGCRIGEGCELVNGIIGYGCRVFYGVKALRFLLGSNSQLQLGARMVDSILGDNSTISCCEVLNSLIYPGHEQHHNNSFLCAAVVFGQSNIAAGVTAGSNHNSRANDGELVAGRGFWPGLCVSLKHNSRFASYALLAKGSYPAELDVPLPFSLVSNDETNGCLLIMPAFWFLYNMFALARNSWKYSARDKRIHKEQKVEFDALAPDTVEEMFRGLELLEVWTGEAAARAEGADLGGIPEEELGKRGHDLLRNAPDAVTKLDVLAANVENSRRPVRILKAGPAYACYRDMIHYYAVKTLVDYATDNKISNLASFKETLGRPHRGEWINAGGQLMRREDAEDLKDRIRAGVVDSWQGVHDAYGRLWERYPGDKARHALGALLDVNELSLDALDETTWQAMLDRAAAVRDWIADRTVESRSKDHTSPFRRMVYDTPAEMNAVLGTLEGNDFIRQTHEDTAEFRRRIDSMRNNGNSAKDAT